MSFLTEAMENILQRENLPSQEKTNNCDLQDPVDECHFGHVCLKEIGFIVDKLLIATSMNIMRGKTSCGYDVMRGLEFLQRMKKYLEENMVSHLELHCLPLEIVEEILQEEYTLRETCLYSLNDIIDYFCQLTTKSYSKGRSKCLETVMSVQKDLENIRKLMLEKTCSHHKLISNPTVQLQSTEQRPDQTGPGNDCGMKVEQPIEVKNLSKDTCSHLMLASNPTEQLEDTTEQRLELSERTTDNMLQISEASDIEGRVKFLENMLEKSTKCIHSLAFQLKEKEEENRSLQETVDKLTNDIKILLETMPPKHEVTSDLPGISKREEVPDIQSVSAQTVSTKTKAPIISQVSTSDPDCEIRQKPSFWRRLTNFFTRTSKPKKTTAQKESSAQTNISGSEETRPESVSVGRKLKKIFTPSCLRQHKNRTNK